MARSTLALLLLCAAAFSARTDAQPAQCTNVSAVLATTPLTSLAAAVSAVPAVSTLLNSVPSATLKNITVFAPLNSAFANLLAALPGPPTLAALAAYPAVLGTVLQYHVVPGYFPNTSVTNSTAATALAGASLTLRVSPAGAVTVAGAFSTATVITANAVNLPACGLVVHIIDTVLLPVSPATASNLFGICPAPGLANVSSYLATQPTLSTLGAVLAAAPTANTLLNTFPYPSGNITIFAPQNSAFASLLAALPGNPGLAQLAAFPAVLTSVLAYHVVPGYFPADKVTNGATVPTTFTGSSVSFAVGSGVTVIGAFSNATVVTPNAVKNPACGLTVHIISAVLLPVSAADAAVAFQLTKAPPPPTVVSGAAGAQSITVLALAMLALVALAL